MSRNDGGSAFPMPSGPEPRVNSTTHYNEGMTLRDYFAAKAMQAYLARNYTQQEVASEAYGMADIMLAEREKDSQP